MTLSGQPCIADSIVSAAGMLIAIEFDDQACLAAAKVGDVAPDRLLANEFEACETAVAQAMP